MGPKIWIFLLPLSVLPLCSPAEDWLHCSSLCHCKWVSGKKTAECVGQNMTRVPTDLSSEVQILDLAQNRIGRLENSTFTQANLVNLHKLVLRSCSLESIEVGALWGLGIVVEIDLAQNQLREIHPGTFMETERLKILNLAENQLEFLEDGVFRDLVHLQKVVLSNNRLSKLGERTFGTALSLQVLKLDGNELTMIEPKLSLEGLTKLNTLDLWDNPWICDCRLRSFRDWALSRRLYSRPTSCKAPKNLQGKMWDEVTSEEFECRSQIRVSEHVELRKGGGDVKIWCFGSGVLGPKLFWTHKSRVLRNSTSSEGEEPRYVLTEGGRWLNLTIKGVRPEDEGDYVCTAQSLDDIVEKAVSLTFERATNEGSIVSSGILLGVGIGVLGLLILLFLILGLIWRKRRGRLQEGEKKAEELSGENHGLGDEEKTYIAATDPNKTEGGPYTTPLNRTLEEDSVLADGPKILIRNGDHGIQCSTPELEKGLPGRGTSYRHFPPDLLAFSGARGASPTSQASTVPDNSRLTSPQHLPSPLGSPCGLYTASYRTLPHNRSMGPSPGPSHYNNGLGMMLRHGYMTIPRRPRAPSWGNGPPPQPGQDEAQEPIYDSFGPRTTADGSSVLSLNKSPTPGMSSMRGRPLPRTPTGGAHYSTMQRSTPNILASSPLDRAPPEGALKWPARLPDEINHRIMQTGDCQTLGRKLPPRPPPKPDNTGPQGPLFEDEGEDGTEV